MVLSLGGRSLFGRNSLFKASAEDGQGLLFFGDLELPFDISAYTGTEQVFLFNESFSSSFNRWATVDTAGSATKTITSGEAEIDTGTTQNSYIHLVASGYKIGPIAQVGTITVTARVKFNYSANDPNLSAYIGLYEDGATEAQIESAQKHHVLVGYDLYRDGNPITDFDGTSKANGVETDTLTARTTNYVIMKIVFAEGRIDYYVDGTLRGSCLDPNDIPMNTILNPIIYIKNYSAAANEEILVDYFKIERGEQL